MEKFRAVREEERGITLIELMVVIIMIGVLAGIGLQYVVGAVEHARVNTDIAEGRRIKDAMDMFYTKYGRNPIDLTELQSNSFSNAVVSAQKIDGSSLTLDNTNLTTNGIFYVDLPNSAVRVYDITTGLKVWDSASS